MVPSPGMRWKGGAYFQSSTTGACTGFPRIRCRLWPNRLPRGIPRSLRKELAERDIKIGLIEPGFTGADFQYPEFPPEKQVELINQDRMLRAEDIAVAAYTMLAQPRRAAVSLIRVETRLDHP